MLIKGRCRKVITGMLKMYDTATINSGTENSVARTNGHKGFLLAWSSFITESSFMYTPRRQSKPLLLIVYKFGVRPGPAMGAPAVRINAHECRAKQQNLR